MADVDWEERLTETMESRQKRGKTYPMCRGEKLSPPAFGRFSATSASSTYSSPYLMAAPMTPSAGP